MAKECTNCIHKAVCKTAESCDGYVPGCKHFKEENKNNKNMEETKMIGKYVIVRGDRSGVFAGTLAENDGRKVVLNNVRRLWKWYGATECLQIATEGVKRPRDCRFTLTAETITLLDAIEIIPATAEAERIIKEVPVWKM